jgi:hypothetical protein
MIDFFLEVVDLGFSAASTIVLPLKIELLDSIEFAVVALTSLTTLRLA